MATNLPGALFLVPTPLDFGCLPADAEPVNLNDLLPGETLAAAARLTHWVTENAKSTRAFLKRVQVVRPLAAPLQSMHISELPRQVHKKGDHQPGQGDAAWAHALLAPALAGQDLGLVSEAGMPAVADPGSALVRAAHDAGVAVHPLPGPVSLMLALAASGLNGQQFAFAGYVPQEAGARAQQLRVLETQALRTGQTQILIETPYRNAALLQTLLQVLQPGTRLAISCALTLGSQGTRSAPVSQWKRQGSDGWGLPLQTPAVFLIGR